MEHIIGFSTPTTDHKKKIIEQDLESLNLEINIERDSNDNYTDKYLIMYKISFLDSNYINKNDKESSANHLKRLFLTAGWQDLADRNSVVLFKRGAFIEIFKGLDNNIIIGLLRR